MTDDDPGRGPPMACPYCGGDVVDRNEATGARPSTRGGRTGPDGGQEGGDRWVCDDCGTPITVLDSRGESG